MRTKRKPFVSAAIGTIFLLAAAAPADAVTRQQVIVQFDPTPADAFNNDEIRDDDSIDDLAGPINSAITAQIDHVGRTDGSGNPLQPFFAQGSVGEFGELGIQGSSGAVGELDTQIFIESDDFQNITGRAQQAKANFIIDGGRALLFAGSGSLIDFTMTVRKDFDVVFQTAFEFEAQPGGSGFGNNLTLFGDDIGVNQITPGEVEIPLAFVSADLGVIQPNERFELSYQLDISVTVNEFAEVAAFEFSDPFGVDLGGPFASTVTFEDVQAVPLPATAPLLLGAVGALAFAGRRRNKRRPVDGASRR